MFGHGRPRSSLVRHSAALGAGCESVGAADPPLPRTAMCKGRVSGAFVGVCLLSTGSAFATDFNWRLDGIAALGDSYVEEYRFQPPDKSAAKNFVEILAEYRGLNFGTYAEDLTRGEP